MTERIHAGWAMTMGRTVCGKPAAKVALSHLERDITCRRCFNNLVLGHLRERSQSVTAAVRGAGKALVGKEVRLQVGPYKGRIGTITNVSASGQTILYCVMVHRVESKEFLNSDGESRSYRKLTDFEVIL